MNINATLVLQAIVFAILVWFTMKFVWPPITKALDERAQKIADGLAAADKAKADLADMNKKVEAELSTSRNEAAARMADADRRAQAMVEEAKARGLEFLHDLRLEGHNTAGEELKSNVNFLAANTERILRF